MEAAVLTTNTLAPCLQGITLADIYNCTTTIVLRFSVNTRKGISGNMNRKSAAIQSHDIFKNQKI